MMQDEMFGSLEGEIARLRRELAEVTEERDGLAACVERLTKASLDAIHYLPGGKIKAELRDAYDSAPDISLARRDAEEPARHEWDWEGGAGERCVKCGDKDWFAGPVCDEAKLNRQASETTE